jgi:TrmH family RNA methyltransferase
MPPPIITSAKNARVMAAAKLRRRKYRDRQGRTIVDGTREVTRALDSGVAVAEIFFCPRLCSTPDSKRLLERLPSLSADAYEVSEPVFEKLAFGDRAEGVVAVIRTPVTSLERLALPEQPLVAVLESVEKPGNLGAVIRSADGAKVSAVIAAEDQTDLYNPNTIRASLGTIFAMPVAAAPSSEVLAWLRERQWAIYAARVGDGEYYTDVDLTQPAAIVLGAEATGLSDVWQGESIMTIRLPMCGMGDSLNVSAAAAVLFYEALRQRRCGVSGES